MLQVAFPLLSLLIWLPIAGGVAIFVLGGDARPQLARMLALAISMVCLALCYPLWVGFDTSTAAMQFIELLPWFPNIEVNYALGVDGFSMPLIVLTCVFTPLVIISAWQVIQDRVAHYMAAFLVMQGLMCGVFAAMDSILFLYFLGSHADPDVFDYWRLGWA